MNDVVFRLDNYEYTQEENELMSALQFDVIFEAVGASYPIAIAMQLDDTPATAVASVSYSSATVNDYAATHIQTFGVEANGVESDETLAVIPLVDEIHALFGSKWFINTVAERADSQLPPITVTVTVNFATPVSIAQADFQNLNFFIMSNVDKYPVNNPNVKRREVHLVSFPPTSKADTNIFGYHNDNTPWPDGAGTGEFTYISKDGLAWGIAVPADVKWMNEWTKITDGYLQMENWMKGELGADLEPIQWWVSDGTNFDEGKLFTLK
jgi:LruC domain-containing protein